MRFNVRETRLRWAALACHNGAMRRHGQVLRLVPGKVEEYRRLHAQVWPEVLHTLRACHVRDYTIFLRRLDDGRDYLFGTFEHHGQDFAADMRRMAADPATQRWWSLCEPCQEPLRERAAGEWWAEMEVVFHAD
jgi:L-rhamnose mutarotase